MLSSPHRDDSFVFVSGFLSLIISWLLFSSQICFHLFSVPSPPLLISIFSPHPLFFSFPTHSSFQMARNKRKVVATIARGKDILHDLVSVSDGHGHDGSVVLALKVAPAAQPSVVLRESPSDLPHMPSSKASEERPYALSLVPEFASGSKPLDKVLVEDYSDDEELLEEEQLDFNFLDKDCDGSPKSPTLIPPYADIVSPPSPSDGRAPITSVVAGNLISSTPSSSKWRDLFSSNKSIVSCTKLQNFSLNHLTKTCAISLEDFQPKFDVWNLCVVGYVSGKSPGYRVLNNIISNVWKCEAPLITHDSRWLVYKFKSKKDKLVDL